MLARRDSGHLLLVQDDAQSQAGCGQSAFERAGVRVAERVEEGVVHYCVTNMPGVVPHTSTYALTNATLPYVLALATRGVSDAVRDDPALTAGVNTAAGHVTNAVVAQALGREPVSPAAALA
jgi:alanine dehydrogenase